MHLMNGNVGKFSLVVGVLWVVLSFPSRLLYASSSELFANKIRADVLLKEGRIDAAIPLYEEVIEKDRKFVSAYYNLATAYYLRGELGKALRALETLTYLRPRDAEALYNLGCLNLRTGAFVEAERYFSLAHTLSPQGPLAQKITEALHWLKDLRQPTF